MKQHITLEQWDEVTAEQKNKLWRRGFTEDCKMNIGQMLEFLGKSKYILTNKGGSNMCDALWEAVKHKLKTL